jgi:hypothetical protein
VETARKCALARTFIAAMQQRSDAGFRSRAKRTT